ncbi:arginine/agmatine antiporter [Burkholderia cepacia]|uniref:arginine/agmatine antiporter n=1 Tax=Burkholderia cepacia TaxID=292 RepID=UPI001CF38420|nr:arginine/agmatine antiporter [Burkholderia cepacia]MCA7905140.1 arginine/agmatine antiporter [Burkholderia cepacia]
MSDASSSSSRAAATPDAASAPKIGVIPATLMVAGNMMGSGVFMLPANLAATGGIAIFGWLITVVGAVSLALVFAKLAAIDPAAGGPYAYARKSFGPYMGYQTNLIYWLANVLGNVGLAVAGLGYLTHFFPVLKDPLVFALAQIFVIWLFTYANILGPNVVGRVQSVTTVFALVPILGMAVFGWFWFSKDVYFAGWNVSGTNSFSAIGATLNFTLWAFIGVESASVSAGVVENPSRNVPIATVGGVVLAAVCYVLSSTVIMGMIPNKALLASSAPFADAARLALGNTAANAVALCAALGCLGSLAGWTLLVGQTAKAAADDGLFASVFARVNSKNVPSAGLAIVALIMSVQVLATMSPSASEQFGKIASIAVIMTLLPYIYSCIAIKVLGYGKMPSHQFTFYTIVGLIGAVYALWAMVGSDGQQTRWSLIFVVATIVFYELSINRQREIEETHVHPGGRSPRWVRYLALGVTIAALAATFWISVGRHQADTLHARSPAVAESAQATQQTGE